MGQLREPIGKTDDRFGLNALQCLVVHRSVDFAASRIENSRAEGAGPEAGHGLEVRNSDYWAAGGVAEALNDRESDADASEGAGSSGAGEAGDTRGVEGVAFEYRLDGGEDDVSEAFGGVQRNFLLQVAIPKQSQAAELSGSVEC